MYTRSSSHVLQVELGIVGSSKKKCDYPGAVTISMRSTGPCARKAFDETVAMATSGGSAYGIIDKKAI